MSVSDEMKNNFVYKLIVLDTVRDKYNWKEM
jgi:hypothetical protein